jgi:signal transduction protein with GAF and PtsI domain
VEFKEIGGGTPYDGEAREGTARIVEDARDVLSLLRDGDLEKIVVFLRVPGTTTLGPVMRRIRGVVCTRGRAGSHLAIVSRELGLPCVMGADIDLEAVRGRQVRIEPSGAVAVAQVDGRAS